MEKPPWKNSIRRIAKTRHMFLALAIHPFSVQSFNPQKMHLKTSILLIALLGVACNSAPQQSQPSIVGTWELISATSTENDSTFSTFNPNLRMIKIINPTHFAFFNHDLKQGKDSATAMYSGGGGKYTLVDSAYTEHLEYFNDRQWENNTFHFVVTIENDTLTQKGVEKLEKLGIDRIIVEKYKRVQP